MRLSIFIVAGLLFASPALSQSIFSDVFKKYDSSKAETSRDYMSIRGFGSIQDQNNLLFEGSNHIASAYGHRFGKNWRVEAEYASRNADIVGLNGAKDAKGTFKSDNVGLNVYRDIPLMRRFKPYVGVGVGLGSMKFNFSGPADIDPLFNVEVQNRIVSRWWNAQLGFTTPITQSLSLGAGVEYFSYEDESLQSNIVPHHIDGINRNYNFYISAVAHLAPKT